MPRWSSMSPQQRFGLLLVSTLAWLAHHGHSYTPNQSESVTVLTCGHHFECTYSGYAPLQAASVINQAIYSAEPNIGITVPVKVDFYNAFKISSICSMDSTVHVTVGDAPSKALIRRALQACSIQGHMPKNGYYYDQDTVPQKMTLSLDGKVILSYVYAPIDWSVIYLTPWVPMYQSQNDSMECNGSRISTVTPEQWLFPSYWKSLMDGHKSEGECNDVNYFSTCGLCGSTNCIDKWQSQEIGY